MMDNAACFVEQPRPCSSQLNQISNLTAKGSASINKPNWILGIFTKLFLNLVPGNQSKVYSSGSLSLLN